MPWASHSLTPPPRTDQSLSVCKFGALSPLTWASGYHLFSSGKNIFVCHHSRYARLLSGLWVGCPDITSSRKPSMAVPLPLPCPHLRQPVLTPTMAFTILFCIRMFRNSFLEVCFSHQTRSSLRTETVPFSGFYSQCLALDPDSW